MESIEKRYLHDSMFHAAVKAILNMISEETGLTPLDIRDAAFLARLIYERERPYPIIMEDNGYRG